MAAAGLESGREKVEVQNPIHRHVLLGLVVPPPVAHNVGLDEISDVANSGLVGRWE